LREAIQEALAALDLEADFALLAPRPARAARATCRSSARPARFRQISPPASSDRCAPIRTVAICEVGPGAAARYVERMRARGARLGDIKPAALSPLDGWREVLDGAGDHGAYARRGTPRAYSSRPARQFTATEIPGRACVAASTTRKRRPSGAMSKPWVWAET